MSDIPILVFSRQRNEFIEIGDAQVIVLEVKDGGKVRLGVRAPQSVPVNRGEDAVAARQQRERDARLAGEDVRTMWGTVRIPA